MGFQPKAAFGAALSVITGTVDYNRDHEPRSLTGVLRPLQTSLSITIKIGQIPDLNSCGLQPEQVPLVSLYIYPWTQPPYIILGSMEHIFQFHGFRDSKNQETSAIYNQILGKLIKAYLGRLMLLVATMQGISDLLAILVKVCLSPR